MLIYKHITTFATQKRDSLLRCGWCKVESMVRDLSVANWREISGVSDSVLFTIQKNGKTNKKQKRKNK